MTYREPEMIEALRGAWLVSRCAMLCFVYSSFLSLTLSPFLPFAPFTIAVFDTDNAGKDILRSGEGGGGPGMLHACNVKVAALVFLKKLFHFIPPPTTSCLR